MILPCPYISYCAHTHMFYILSLYIYIYNLFLYTNIQTHSYYSSNFRLINEAYCKDFDVGNCHNCFMGWPSTNFYDSTKSHLVGRYHVIYIFYYLFGFWYKIVLWRECFSVSKVRACSAPH